MTINEAHLAYVQVLLESGFKDYEATLHNKKDDFGNDKNPYISISQKDMYSSKSIHHSLIVRLSQLLPFAHIYIHGSDSDIFIVIHDKTYEQLEKEQLEESNKNA